MDEALENGCAGMWSGQDIIQPPGFLLTQLKLPTFQRLGVLQRGHLIPGPINGWWNRINNNQPEPEFDSSAYWHRTIHWATPLQINWIKSTTYNLTYQVNIKYSNIVSNTIEVSLRTYWLPIFCGTERLTVVELNKFHKRVR